MADKEKSRRRVLNLIREQKKLLFGAFSPTVTNIDEEEAWRKISSVAVERGLIKSDKDGKYIRDVFWQNARKRTLKKVDDHKKTGAAGGEGAVLDDQDQMVLDIVGMFENKLYYFHSLANLFYSQPTFSFRQGELFNCCVIEMDRYKYA